MMRDCEKPSGVMLLLMTGAVDVAAIREVTELAALPSMMIDCEKKFGVMLLIMTVAVDVEAMGCLWAVIELAALVVPSSLLMRDRGIVPLGDIRNQQLEMLLGRISPASPINIAATASPAPPQ